MDLPKGDQTAWQRISRHCITGGDPNAALNRLTLSGRHAGDAGCGFAHLRDMSEKLSARLGQLHDPCSAFKQGKIKGLLQSRNLTAECRLGLAQRTRGG